jgi:hypothetical protein
MVLHGYQMHFEWSTGITNGLTCHQHKHTSMFHGLITTKRVRTQDERDVIGTWKLEQKNQIRRWQGPVGELSTLETYS